MYCEILRVFAVFRDSVLRRYIPPLAVFRGSILTVEHCCTSSISGFCTAGIPKYNTGSISSVGIASTANTRNTYVLVQKYSQYICAVCSEYDVPGTRYTVMPGYVISSVDAPGLVNAPLPPRKTNAADARKTLITPWAAVPQGVPINPRHYFPAT